MRFIDRLIIFIFSLLLIAMGAEAAFLCFNSGLINSDAEKIYSIMTGYSWLVLLVAAALLVIGLLIMFGSAFHRKGQSKSTAINTKTHGENVQISVGAIDCIVGQVVKGYSQVKSVSTDVAQTPEGIKIRAKAVVNGDINIPELAEELQQDIKIQLETMVGLQVKEVKIVITDVVPKPIMVAKPSVTTWDDGPEATAVEPDKKEQQ